MMPVRELGSDARPRLAPGPASPPTLVPPLLVFHSMRLNDPPGRLSRAPAATGVV